MSKKNANIQTDFVVNVLHERQVEKQDDVTNDLVFQLIDIKAFNKLFKEYYPRSKDNPERLWHSLFGNDPSGIPEGLNKEVHYLTLDSCQKILEHYQIFQKSGIDFDHLPSGFFLTRNPIVGGVRDVLHYSEFLAENNPQPNSFSVILSPKKQISTFEAHQFIPPQSLWYEFLRTKMQSGSTTYCTEKELKKAFIQFSNTLARLDLKFNEPDFSALKDDFNPIILMGRWNTLLTQPHLKKEDVAQQFQVLTRLKLHTSYGTLRAINDYKSSENPCSIILPEMFEDDKYYNAYRINNAKNIYSLSDFWNYIAFQPQRNSIDYYKNGIQQIDKMSLNDDQKQKFQIILAASSTGSAHLAKIDETITSDYWNKLCDLIDNITSVTKTMSVVCKALGADQIKNNFILHIERLNQLPNIAFLHSMALCIQSHIETLNPIQATAAIATRTDPLNNLVILSDKLNQLIIHYSSNFYEGARFYFVDGQWEQLNVQLYTELQHYVYQSGLHIFVPYLSNFNILTAAEVDEITEEFRNYDTNQFNYCLGLFRDAIKPCSKYDLLKIIADVNTAESVGSFMSVIEYVEKNFASAFPSNYFLRKKQELMDAQYGLNEEQIIAIRELNLTEEQTQSLIRIESAMLRRNPSITSNEFNELNEVHLINLSRLISATDLTFLLEKLDFAREQLIPNTLVLGNLFKRLSKERCLDSFKQIYYKNLSEKCNDESLIPKFVLFIDEIKPLAKSLGTISVPAVEELLASFVLNSSMGTINDRDFITKIEKLFTSIPIQLEGTGFIV